MNYILLHFYDDMCLLSQCFLSTYKNKCICLIRSTKQSKAKKEQKKISSINLWEKLIDFCIKPFDSEKISTKNNTKCSINWNSADDGENISMVLLLFARTYLLTSWPMFLRPPTFTNFILFASVFFCLWKFKPGVFFSASQNTLLLPF